MNEEMNRKEFQKEIKKLLTVKNNEESNMRERTVYQFDNIVKFKHTYNPQFNEGCVLDALFTAPEESYVVNYDDENSDDIKNYEFNGEWYAIVINYFRHDIEKNSFIFYLKDDIKDYTEIFNIFKQELNKECEFLAM